jgi:conjugative relaxase-like TrwC/TraI family protein
VLSPKTQTNLKNAKSYFTEHLSVGGYYGENARVQGQWLGEGAIALGLAGTVVENQFLALCENQNPQTGGRLTQRQKAARRVFYDFTFSPPKSVSVAALVAADERIVSAHARAVKLALGELERFAAVRLRRQNSKAHRRTGNIVAALFQHETSRALDPHLHTHCVVFNATYDNAEGRWKALENCEMLGAQKYAENVYYHKLAQSLREFGYTITNSQRGDFEIAEIAPEICERFSKRHREIDEKTRAFLASYPEKHAENEAAIREHIAHKDRARKTSDIGSERLQELWLSQLSVEEVASLRQAERRDGQFEQNFSAAEAVTWAETHLFERRSVVLEHELWRHALEAARGASVSLAEIKTETASRVYLRDDTGKVAHRDVLAREWEIVQAARDGIGGHAPLATVPRSSGLAEDQSRALDVILRSRDFITLFRGGAGTGKSFVLRAVQEAIDGNKRRSLVLAPQRQQVIHLARDGLIGTQTVRECLQRGDLAERAIVIVDEAGQLDGRQLLDLIRLVRERGGRLVLCGDTRQHGPVEASDALRAIERYSGLRAAELNQIRRQEPERGRTAAERKRIRDYREAVKAAATGQLTRSFEKLEELGAVAECNFGEQSARLCGAYLDIIAQGESAVVVSQTRAEVREINDAIRERLRERGLLSSKETEITALEQVDLTRAQKLDARHYPDHCAVVFNRDLNGCRRGERGKLIGITRKRLALEVNGQVRHVPLTHIDHINVCQERALPLSPGDRLQLKANSATADGRKLANGEIVTVAQIKSNGAIRLADGRVLPPRYRQFVRGYAVTSYGSQGKTVDHVLFSDSAIRAATNAHQWYVTISRGRRSIQIFTPDKEQLRHSITRSGERELALDLLRARVRRHDLRHHMLHSIRRGREFARRIARLAMHCWIAALIKSHLKPTHEIRNSQTDRVVHASVLAT